MITVSFVHDNKQKLILDDSFKRKISVYFIIVYAGGAADGYEAADTREKEIVKSFENSKALYLVYRIDVDDLSDLIIIIKAHNDIASMIGIPSTVEASFFGHCETDGPRGEWPMKNKSVELSTVSGFKSENGQLTPEGWELVPWNFDKNNSIASFYGCNSGVFANKFIDYNTNVLYAAGILGKAGGSKTYKGEISRSIIPPHFIAQVYMVDVDDNGIVQKKVVFKRGGPFEPGSFTYEKYGRFHRNHLEERIYGNITVKKGKAINGSKELNP